MGRLNVLGRLLQFRDELFALWRAFLAPGTPLHLKALMLLVPLYLISPIDLIPDFIPVLGYLDDVLLVPLGILLVIRLLPPALLAEHRASAAAIIERPVSKRGMAVIIAIWLAAAALAVWLVWRWFAAR